MLNSFKPNSGLELCITPANRPQKGFPLVFSDPPKAARPVPFVLGGIADRLLEINLDWLQCAPGLYFLVQCNRVVYVGKTTYLAQRLLEHVRTKQFDRVVFLPVADPERRAWLETEFIRTLRPMLNGHARLAVDAPHYRQSLEELLALEFAEPEDNSHAETETPVVE
jgi:hypothetical protein